MPYKFKHSIKQEVISPAQKLWHIASNKLLCYIINKEHQICFLKSWLSCKSNDSNYYYSTVPTTETLQLYFLI